MKRYHKKIYFPDIEELKAFNESLKGLKYRFTSHCIDRLKEQVTSEAETFKILGIIKSLDLDYNAIFEYYITSDILKACYRVKYTENNDIILVISKTKDIITIYLNESGDNHITLNESLYNKE
jgi:hypothetical protein